MVGRNWEHLMPCLFCFSCWSYPSPTTQASGAPGSTGRGCSAHRRERAHTHAPDSTHKNYLFLSHIHPGTLFSK